MSRIPKEIHPFQPRSVDEIWSETLRLKQFPRVVESVLETAQEVPIEAEVRVELDALGDTHFRYRLTTTVYLQCQRCLEAVEYPIRLDGDLLVERPGRTPQRDDLEWVEVDERGVLVPMDVLEEEFLLALPLAPRHADCRVPDHESVDEDRRPVTIGHA